jgi:hypothetical protein
MELSSKYVVYLMRFKRALHPKLVERNQTKYDGFP